MDQMRSEESACKPMERRKFLVGMGSLAAGASAVMGTGAVSNGLLRRRHVKGQVVADNNAYVSLRTDPNAEHDWAVDYDNQGRLLLNFGADNGMGGHGLNPDSILNFDKVFALYNADTDPDGYDAWFKVQASQKTGNPNWIYYGEDETNRVNSGNKVHVPKGETRLFGVHLNALNYKSGETFGPLSLTVHLDRP